LIVDWAKACGLVRVARGRLVAVKKYAPLLERPDELWNGMFDVELWVHPDARLVAQPAWMGLKPVLDLLGAARGEVVADRDDLLALQDGGLAVEVVEEADQVKAVAGL
jgi:hypothetical protein